MPVPALTTGAPGTSGSAERELTRWTLRFSVMMRTLVVAVSSLLSLGMEQSRNLVMATLVVAALNLWNVGFAVLLLRAARRWLMPVDILVVSAMCLAQVWTAAPDISLSGTTWTLASISIIVVAYQLQTPPLPGALATAAVVAAYLGGVALAEPDQWTAAAPLGLWIAAEAALSRTVFVLVLRGGRAADRLMARGERARRDAEVAAARRDDEREYLAALHDTASATLLMVGAGVVGGREPWLAEQAARDLDVILGRTEPAHGEVDLVGMLRTVGQTTPLRINWRATEALAVPTTAALALSHGTREALTNIVRHAGIDVAAVSVHREEGSVIVEVRDDGRGFDPRRVPSHRYGLTRSLAERMARTGGRALVESRPGCGTVVRMEWPVDPD